MRTKLSCVVLFFVGYSNRFKCEEAGIDFYIFPSPKGINVRTSLEKQLDPRGPIASRGRSVQVFQRKPIAACGFPSVSTHGSYENV